jgi:hypothetical protein
VQSRKERWIPFYIVRSLLESRRLTRRRVGFLPMVQTKRRQIPGISPSPKNSQPDAWGEASLPLHAYRQCGVPTTTSESSRGRERVDVRDSTRCARGYIGRLRKVISGSPHQGHPRPPLDSPGAL